jgi:hypothetical protein
MLNATRSDKAGRMAEMEYFCTQSAHNPESLARHMNTIARDGWELVTVDFAIRGETGFHTFFWRRPLDRSAEGRRATPR